MHRPDRVEEIRALAAAGIQLAVPLRTRREILGVLLSANGPATRVRRSPLGVARVTLSASRVRAGPSTRVRSLRAGRSAPASARTRNKCCARAPISSR